MYQKEQLIVLYKTITVAKKTHPKLDPKQRLSFAEGYSNERFPFDWYKVIFSDEMCVWKGHKGRVNMYFILILNVQCTYSCIYIIVI